MVNGPSDRDGMQDSGVPRDTPLMACTFAISPLTNLSKAGEASYKGRGLPAHPPIIGREGQHYGHEWARWVYDTLDQRLDQILATRFSAGAAILDLGCATGVRARMFSALGHRVTAVDIADGPTEDWDGRAASSQGSHEAAGREPVTFLQADIRRLPDELLAQAFDVVHARRVMTFIPIGQLPAMLDGVTSALRPGGLFVASFISLEVAPSEMRCLHPPGAASLALHPGMFGHRFGEVHYAMQDHGLAMIEAFTDFEIEVGLIAQKSGTG